MIEIHESVYEAMYAEFSKKSVDKALEKYSKVLSNLIHISITNDYACTAYSQYQIPMKVLHDTGGRITDSKGKKVRVHSWLKDNKPIIKVLNMGNSLQKVKSTISLIDNRCTYTDLFDMSLEEYEEKQLNIQTDDFLDNEMYDDLFYREYPEVLYASQGLMSADDCLAMFHPIEVNTTTLTNYLNWLIYDSTKLDEDQRKSYIRKAKMILALAHKGDGYWFQRKKQSVFGRLYYVGLSMHNIPREMRKNVLGDSWQYDISSSSIAWKYSYAAAYNREVKPERFQYTNHYLTDKEDFIQDCLKHVFLCRTYKDKAGNVHRYDPEWCRKKIKAMMNAISFGAKVFGIVIPNPKDPDNPLVNSLGVILKDNEIRDAFLNHDLISGFIHEHMELAEFILEKNKSILAPLTCTKTDKGCRNKAKEMAYLYQHAETAIMTSATSIAETMGHEILIGVHDAFIVRNKIAFDDLQEIELRIKTAFGMPYWKLVGEKLTGYTAMVGPRVEDNDRKVAIHRLVIREQEYELSRGNTTRIIESDIDDSLIEPEMRAIKEERERYAKRHRDSWGTDYFDGSDHRYDSVQYGDEEYLYEYDDEDDED
jgi:hypothetical protein